MLPRKVLKYRVSEIAFSAFRGHQSPFKKYTLFIYLPAFLDTGLPRGNVHSQRERDSGEGLDGGLQMSVVS